MVGKLAVGGAVAGVGALAFAGGFVGGYLRGIEYALDGVKELRVGAECRGDGGCEWVYAPGRWAAGEPVDPRDPGRHLRPFSDMGLGLARVPVLHLLGEVPFLKDLRYDLAGPLASIGAPRRAADGDGRGEGEGRGAT